MSILSQAVYGVDFGSDTAKVYSYRKNRIITEKNMIAVREPDTVIAVGNQAYEMFGKNPPNIDVRGPVRSGRVADADRAGFILKKLLQRADADGGLPPSLYIACPLDMSRIEKRAYLDIGADANIRPSKLRLVEKPLCDAISVGLVMRSTRGSMIVNIGAGGTMISIFAQGHIVISERFPYGGDEIDENICEIVRRRTNVLIDVRTACRLKYAMGDLMETEDARRTIGMDTLSGVPGEVVVTSAMVREAAAQEADRIASAVRSFLERIPPQIAGFIRAEGVYLTGGSARIRNLALYLQEKSGVVMHVSSGYEYSTINGLKELILHKSLQKYAYTIKDVL